MRQVKPEQLAAAGLRADNQTLTGVNKTMETEWPEPGEITTEHLLPVEAIPVGIIPDEFRDWNVDIAHRMQCPADFTSVAAVVAVSAVIGAGCAIRPKKNDDWEVVPNLWGGIVARPSMLKSPSLAEVMKPLTRLEAEEKERYDEDMKVYNAGNEKYKAQREALKQEMLNAAKGKAKPGRDMSVIETELAALDPNEEPTRRRYRTNDTTVEKLGELLNENPRGILVFRDELTGLLSSWDREDRQSDRAFFLEGWNGNQSFITDRIGRGTIDVGNVCISILGGIQPAKLTAYLLQAAGSLTNDGMIQRFQLLVYPDEPKTWELVDEKPDTDAKNRVYNIFKILADMDFITAGAMQENGGRPYFRFDEEGQAIFYEWLTELETRLREEEQPMMCEHLAKFRSLMPSLALIFHLIKTAAGGIPGPVTAEAASKAAAWTEYLESHARRIYGLIADTRTKSAAALAGKIRDGKVKDGFTVREIYPKGWTMLNTPELVETACQELMEVNWVRRAAESLPNRQPKTVYRINPKLLKNA